MEVPDPDDDPLAEDSSSDLSEDELKSTQKGKELSKSDISFFKSITASDEEVSIPELRMFFSVWVKDAVLPKQMADNTISKILSMAPCKSFFFTYFVDFILMF